MLRYNENKLDEMCKILEHLDKYVPSVDTTFSVELPDGDQIVHEDVVQRRLLIFGDQLTSARIRGAQAIHSYHDRQYDQLLGFTIATSDWHPAEGSYFVLYIICRRFFGQ